MVQSAILAAQVQPVPEAKPVPPAQKVLLPMAPRVSLVKLAKLDTPATPETPARMVLQDLQAFLLGPRAPPVLPDKKATSATQVKRVPLAKLAPPDKEVPDLTAIWATLEPRVPLALRAFWETLA